MNKLQLNNRTFNITWLAMLTALQVIVGRIHLGPSFLKVGFGFVITALIGYYFGPAKSTLAALIADIIANTIFPPQGGFFWGFTLSAVVTGFLYGINLYHNQPTSKRLLMTTIEVTLIVNWLLNTLWVCVLGNLNFGQMLWIRGIKEVVFIPIQTIILVLLFKWLQNRNFTVH